MEPLLVMVAGAVGVLVRYAVGRALNFDPAHGFPSGTLAVNLVGALAIGLLMGAVAAGTVSRGGTAAVVVAIGLLGGLTTFSSFAFDAVALIDAGRAGTAAAYVGVTNAAGLLLAGGGFVLARALVGPVAL